MANLLQKLEVNKFFTHNRLDLFIKQAFAKSILESSNTEGCWERLYCLHIIRRNGAIEPKNISTDYVKKDTICDFRDQFKKAINFFSEEKEKIKISIDKNHSLVDGAHRLAIAGACNVEYVNAEVLSVNTKHLGWGYDQLPVDLFSLNDHILIAKELLNFLESRNDSYNIAIFWNGTFNAISKKMFKANDVKIWYQFNIDFDNCFTGFSQFVYELYNTSSENQTIYKKINELFKLGISPLIVIYEVDDVFRFSTEFKDKYRKLEFENIGNRFNAVHNADCSNERKDLGLIISSFELSKYYSRIGFSPNPRLLKFISELKVVADNNSISLDHICVVGSACLSLYNITNASDIDIILSSKFRAQFTSRSEALSKNIDLVNQQYHRSNFCEWIKDDDIIFDDSNHIVFAGVKFATLEIVLDRKRFQSRNKDKLHANLIEYFFRYEAGRIYGSESIKGLLNYISRHDGEGKFNRNIFLKLLKKLKILIRRLSKKLIS